jgi:NAD(P)-dependent dehydrogenase (short-subunit alcohol dehydrogenase family)
VAQLTKALANEWAGRNVQVNAIAPGYIATDNTTALRADAVRNRAILARIPAGRWGEAEVPRLAGVGLRERHRAHGGWRVDGAVGRLPPRHRSRSGVRSQALEIGPRRLPNGGAIVE